MKKKEVKKRELVELIHEEFPHLAFSKAKLINTGEDHAVLMLDQKIVFRFPRNSGYRKSFASELVLLDALKRSTTLKVPDYIYLSRRKDFGGYNLIDGKELTKERFDKLNSKERANFVTEIANFLTALHGVPKKSVPLRASEPWSTAKLRRYKTRYLRERRETIALLVSKKMLKQIDMFYDQFGSYCAKGVTRVIHGDLSDDHMLLDTKRNELIGVIDLGDAAIGDPAHDFAFFWCYGDDIATAVYEHYGFQNDNDLLARSRWYHMRFVIDLVYFFGRDGEKRKYSKAIKVLKKRLPVLIAHTNFR